MPAIANKILLIVLDGGSDRPVNGTTPLASADKPGLDALANGGINGIMDTVDIGVRPGSDVSHLALLGYDPYKYYTGRGPFEAAGVGIDVKKGDVAFRCDFATVEDGTVKDRRAGRIQDTDALAAAISEKVKVPGVDIIFKRSTGHRAALVLRGKGLSPDITDTDPHRDGLRLKECRATADTPEAKHTAGVVNSISEQAMGVLGDHPLNVDRKKQRLLPANAILLRGAGGVPEMPDFYGKYDMKGAVIASAGLIIGVGKLCGMECLTVGEMGAGLSGATERAKVEKAIAALGTHDFVLVNIKGADEAGHDGDFAKKKKFFEEMDPAFQSLLHLQRVLVIVTADHSTPVLVKRHTADPVPIVIHGPGVRIDDVSRFNELIAYQGGLHRLKGLDVMPIALDLLDKEEKYGA
ncbi:2,3-bisphosphoglycerate-independent phosphoglycerate mutase [Methanocella paludicola SANAE]|uniref:2,3-bisphosphoglycerate-independent phosphoglycerate mutase n=1 Tax=Methanocella paludicola (strain DSM 17711 / JCM 13418 / NBRC 101707 / SANAE) TaxID=304371 RepID=D1YY13_METPS|nr:2,3-bisphosphoglycerate-independent phosphoglycerate mutase [Methanocella paludicola SANAE]